MNWVEIVVVVAAATLGASAAMGAMTVHLRLRAREVERGMLIHALQQAREFARTIAQCDSGTCLNCRVNGANCHNLLTATLLTAGVEVEAVPLPPAPRGPVDLNVN